MDQSEDFGQISFKKVLGGSQLPLEDLTPQQDYVVNINQLISQPNKPSATQYFLTTLYQLSQYLFRKKLNVQGVNQNELSFDQYLNSFSKQINVYEGHHKKGKFPTKQYQLQIEQSTQQLMQCYSRIPYAYFSPGFKLDFGQLAKNIEEIKKKQQKLNDDLDLVEINLFTQIHNKFHQYFKIVSNFQYLNYSLEINIQKNRQARQRINRVKVDFVQKSYSLKSKITHRHNLEKALKLLKIIKSLKKLPKIIKEILQSSLPYQCLSLLRSTKQSLDQVSSLKCLDKVSQTLRESQSLVQLGLNKRYADEIYLYLEECQKVILQENWDRINSNNCVDLSNLGNSMLGVSGILQQSVLEMQPTSSKNKRNEGKQFEIALILLQSYKYMNFPIDLMRIKLGNSLRVFGKRFDSQLKECLKLVLSQKNERLLQSSDEQKPQSKLQNQNQDESIKQLKQIVEKVTVIFYVKHLFSYNEVMKDTIDRFLGYLHTLLTQYNQSKQKDHEKFVQIFKEQLSILTSISKIVIQKLKSLMMVKNIHGVTFTQFRQWISLLQYWKRYTDNLIEQSPLISSDKENDEIEQSINDAFKKMIGIFNINSTISQLVLNFVSVYHQNIINSELEPSFAEESWQSIQIPSQFVQVLNNIGQCQQGYINGSVSVTILNDSKDMKSLNKSNSQDYSNVKKANKFRVLKTNIMVDGVRYKISISFLLLCQFMDEYVKMSRSLPSCRKFIFQRMLNLVQHYNNRSKQLILQAKARQYEKMKSKNISAKHICLVHNCLSVLMKIVRELKYEEVSELRAIVLDNIQDHKNRLINKLSHLIKSKIESTIITFFTGKDQKVSQTNLSLLNVFVQMMGIIDQFLQFEDKKAVLRQAMQIFVNRYFKQLLLKGGQYSGENKILVEKMRFLKQYFPDELEIMEKQAKSRCLQN